MQTTTREPETLSPAMAAAVEALDRNITGATGCGPDAYFRGEEPQWLPPSREAQAIARHRETMAAVASRDFSLWSDR